MLIVNLSQYINNLTCSGSNGVKKGVIIVSSGSNGVKTCLLT